MLVANKQQPHIELPGGGNASGIAVAASQHQAALRLRRARVGQTNMRIQRDHFAFGVLTVIRLVMLMLHAQRRPAQLFAAENRLLLAQRRAIPEFDAELDNAHRLIAAAHGPGGLLLIRRHPQHRIHQRLVGRIGISGAIFETEQVNRRLFTFAARRMV